MVMSYTHTHTHILESTFVLWTRTALASWDTLIFDVVPNFPIRKHHPLTCYDPSDSNFRDLTAPGFQILTQGRKYLIYFCWTQYFMLFTQCSPLVVLSIYECVCVFGGGGGGSRGYTFMLCACMLLFTLYLNPSSTRNQTFHRPFLN